MRSGAFAAAGCGGRGAVPAAQPHSYRSDTPHHARDPLVADAPAVVAEFGAVGADRFPVRPARRASAPCRPARFTAARCQ